VHGDPVTALGDARLTGQARRPFATWPRAPSFVRSLTILLPALLVFGAEIVRHEWLHDILPVMVGNLVTGAIALGISALVLVPLYRRLEWSDARVRRLEIERAVADERERIARELHDGISQALFFLNVEAGTLERSLAGSGQSDSALRTAREITQAVQETASRVRDTIFDLRTAREPGQSFGAWLKTYTRRWGDVHNVTVVVADRAVALPDLLVERELHVMAVVREALHNVAKHARARNVSINVSRHNGDLTIEIVDDGRGLPERVSGPAQGRYGLAALREHAAAAGGAVTVSAAPGGGTAVALVLHGSPESA
jgi:signal transduction histidine kinase